MYSDKLKQVHNQNDNEYHIDDGLKRLGDRQSIDKPIYEADDYQENDNRYKCGYHIILRPLLRRPPDSTPADDSKPHRLQERLE